MNSFSAVLPTRSFLALTIGMMTCLILLINVSFKIFALTGMMFTASSVLCPLIAIIYLIVLKECNVAQQRHILNQCLLALYLFSIGIYLLVNLPAAEYMHDNPAYQIVFEDIPKKFFAATLAFGISFYLPHLLYSSKKKEALISPKKSLLLALVGGFSFFSIDFFLLFSDPPVYNFGQIYADSLMISMIILLLAGVVYLTYLLYDKPIKKIPKATSIPSYLSSPFYHYLVGFSLTIMLISLACEYRLVSFSNGWILGASGILFPFTIMASNLISELYGYRANLCLAIVLIVTELIFDLLLMGAVALPAPSFFNLNPFYFVIMPRRIPVEALALFVTFMSNALLLEYLKYTRFAMDRSSRLFSANFFSTSLLCLVNYNFLYGGIYPHEQIFNLTISAWIYKVVTSILGVPLVLWIYTSYKKQLMTKSGSNKIRFRENS